MTPDQIKTRLLNLKQELKDLDDLSKQARETVTLDQQSVGRLSRMDAMQQQAMANATNQRRQADLIRIEAALERLQNDDYGFCENCGEEIAPKRLEIDPLATRCTQCASPSQSS